MNNASSTNLIARLNKRGQNLSVRMQRRLFTLATRTTTSNRRIQIRMLLRGTMMLNRALNPLLMTRFLILTGHKKNMLLNIRVLNTRSSISRFNIQSRHTIMSRNNTSTNTRYNNSSRAVLTLNNARLSFNRTNNINIIRRSSQTTTNFKRRLDGIRTGPELIRINRRIRLLTKLSQHKRNSTGKYKFERFRIIRLLLSSFNRNLEDKSLKDRGLRSQFNRITLIRVSEYNLSTKATGIGAGDLYDFGRH